MNRLGNAPTRAEYKYDDPDTITIRMEFFEK